MNYKKPEKIKLTSADIEGFVNALLKKDFDGAADIPDCHREWWDMCCSDHKFVAIAAPRGHAKSTAITLSYTLASILFRVRQFVLLVSDTESQSSYFLNNIKKTIDSNEDLKKFFFVKSFVKETETDFILEFEDGYQCRVLAKGSEQKLRGINWNNKRPDLIVCDDMENDEIVMNKERREKFARWFDGALLPCRSRDGVIRFVGTILHMDSMLEILMPKYNDKENVITELMVRSSPKRHWYSAKYRAHNENFSEILWEAYKNEEWLRKERDGYIARGRGDIYSQEYLNVPLDESNSYFRRGDFGTFGAEVREKRLNYYLSADLAVSTKSSADYSVFVVSGVDEKLKLHILEVYRERLDSLDIIDYVLMLNRKYDFDFAVFEKGAITASILPVLNTRMISDNNFVTIHTINPSVDKLTRAQSIRARMRAGQVLFPKESDWYADMETEFVQFPRGRYDDQVDAMSLLGLALDKFVEAPTQEEIIEEEREEDMRSSDLYDSGRSMVTGY